MQDARSAAAKHFSRDPYKQIASLDGARRRPSLVATEGDEMQVSASMMTLEFSGDEENNIPTLSEKLEGMLTLLLLDDL